MRAGGFGRKMEPLRKRMTCSCGGESRLIKRRNFSHGRKSGGRSHMVYKCSTCNKENPISRRGESR